MRIERFWMRSVESLFTFLLVLCTVALGFLWEKIAYRYEIINVIWRSRQTQFKNHVSKHLSFACLKYLHSV